MVRPWVTSVAAILLALALPELRAQSISAYGSVGGIVTDEQGTFLPGVTVTISGHGSDLVQITGEQGTYFAKVRPGLYDLRFELEGFSTVEYAGVEILMRDNATMNVVLGGAIEDVITVTAISTLISLQNVIRWTAKARDNLFALWPEGPRRSQPGKPRGRQIAAHEIDVPIEESIEEVQLSISPISASQGGFLGHLLLDLVTKSGGNEFGGSLRFDFDSPSWSERTGYEVEQGLERTGETSQVRQATLGGFIREDRLWFFVAEQREQRTDQETFRLSPFRNIHTTDGQDLQAKLTAPDRGYGLFLLHGRYRNHDRFASTSPFAASPATSAPIHEDNWGTSVEWSKSVSSWLAAETVFSWDDGRLVHGKRDGGFRDATFLSSRFDLQYGGPFGDPSDAEDWMKGHWSGSLSGFTSRPWGTHELDLGGGGETQRRTGGLSHGAEGLVFDADPLRGKDGLLEFENGLAVPLWRSSGPEVTLLRDFRQTRNLRRDERSYFAYANDVWAPKEGLELNLGVRWERRALDGSGQVLALEADRFLPRLAIGFTPQRASLSQFGLQLSYGEYGSRFEEAFLQGDEPLRTIPNSLWIYTGPEGEGVDFAPGFDLRNYRLLHESRPGGNVFAARDLKLPYARVWGVTLRWRPRTDYEFQASLLDREHRDFLEDFVEDDGQVLLANSNGPSRRYCAAIFSGSARLSTSWRIDGSWTWELEHEGRSEAVQPAQVFPTVYGDYTGTIDLGRAFPYGLLEEYREHHGWVKVGWTGKPDRRIVTGIRADLVARFESGGPFSLVDVTTLDTRQLPVSQPVFFGGRGSGGRFEDSLTFDLALAASLQRENSWLLEDVELWLYLRVQNLLNDQPLQDFDTTVFAVPADDGLPSTYVSSPNFGQAFGRESYAVPRTLSATVALRFGSEAGKR